MANQTFARTALTLIAAVALAGCGAHGPANGSTNPVAAPPAVSAPATTAAGAASPAPATRPNAPAVAAPDISADLQAVDDLLSGVNGDVQQGDDASAAGE